MSKTIATTTIINLLLRKKEEIRAEWRANDGGLTFTAIAAVGSINKYIQELAVYDRVSTRYIREMEACLRKFCVYL